MREACWDGRSILASWGLTVCVTIPDQLGWISAVYLCTDARLGRISAACLSTDARGSNVVATGFCVRACSMNACAHPGGGGRTSRLDMSTR